MTQTIDENEKAGCRWCEVIIIDENSSRRLCHLSPESKATTAEECSKCKHFEKCDNDD